MGKDFGDILKEWDEMLLKEKQKKHQPQIQKSHKKANAPSPEEKELKRLGYSKEDLLEDSDNANNFLEAWLNNYGTVDKDKIQNDAGENVRMHQREYLHNLRCEASIDLHGLTRDEAWARLNGFITDCKRRGLKKVMIVHGKGIHSQAGESVLAPMVRTFIEQDKRLGEFGHPDKKDGGNGSTWVIIRQ